MTEPNRGLRALVLGAMALCIVASLTGARGADQGGGLLKIAVVNPGRLLAEYKFTIKSNDDLARQQADASTTLNAWKSNSFLSEADQKALGDLTVQEGLPAGLDAAKKAQKQKLLDQNKKVFDEYTNLQSKQSPTPADNDRLREISRMAADTDRRIGEKKAEIQGQLEKQAQDIRTRMDLDVRTKLNEVAKKDGINLVFSSEVLLYADNDLTDKVLKELNK